MKRATDVQDRAGPLQGKAGRRVGRGPDRATGVQEHQEVVRQKVVSQAEVQLHEAKLAKAKAKAKLAEAELNFTNVRAPFDGIVDRLHQQQGSLVKEGEILTTLSDNSVMWVYFNVPEARYLEYMADAGQDKEGSDKSNSCWRTATSSRNRQDRRDRGRIQQRDRQHPLPCGFPEPGRPAASRSDRHRVDQPDAEGRHRHPSAGDVRGFSTSGTFTSSNKDRVAHRREIVIIDEMKDSSSSRRGSKRRRHDRSRRSRDGSRR